MRESVIHLEGKNREFGSYGTITATTYSAIPELTWFDISKDLIERLPKSQHFDVTFVVVDRLSKMCTVQTPPTPFYCCKSSFLIHVACY